MHFFSIKDYDEDKTTGGAVNATVTITINSGPEANDSVTVGGNTYKFVSSLSEAYDVKIGDTASQSAENLKDAINANPGGAGQFYGSGTQKNDTVHASASGSIVTVTARDPGTAGNSLTITETDPGVDDITLGGATLSGGIDKTGTLSIKNMVNRRTQWFTEEIADGS